MMCYRDMTFCTFHEDCAKANLCECALTEQVRLGAQRWWRGMDGEPPICTFVNKPECHQAVPPQDAQV